MGQTTGRGGARAARRIALMLLALAVAVGGYYGYTSYLAPMLAAQQDGAGGGGGSGRPPPTVTTAKASLDRWTPTLQATGTLRAVRGVEVTPEIAGVVVAAPMRSGTAVAEGDTLLRLRADELEAGLQALRAQRGEARSAFERAQRLYEQGNAPKARLDEARARFRSLTAQIEEQRARIDKTTVNAPFDGVLGLTDVDVGQYVSPGQPLVTLQDLTPMQANFTLPEQVLPEVSKGQTVRVKLDAYPDMSFEGEVTAIDPRVDEKTRNFEVEATLPNEMRRLRPGMFARVTLEVGEPRERVTLPQTAVVSNPYGNSVYVVQPSDQGPPRVTQQMVATGAERGTQVAVTDGLEGGEQVVTSGQIKLREGAPVQVDNGKQPPDTANPDIQEP
jgi:membrane fusion protein (multidrug efflux system)